MQTVRLYTDMGHFMYEPSELSPDVQQLVRRVLHQYIDILYIDGAQRFVLKPHLNRVHVYRTASGQPVEIQFQLDNDVVYNTPSLFGFRW